MKSSETGVCFRGHLREVFYNDDGEVIEVVELAHGSGCVAVSIQLGWGNSVEVMEGGCGGY